MPVSSRFARNTPSNRPTVGKFCTPEKPIAFSSARNCGISTNGSVPLTPASTGVRLHHRQHLARHLLDDLVGVAVGQQARRASRARPCGSGRSCRSRSGRCRRPPRTWPRGRCRRRRRRSAPAGAPFPGNGRPARSVQTEALLFAPAFELGPRFRRAPARRHPARVKPDDLNMEFHASIVGTSREKSGPHKRSLSGLVLPSHNVLMGSLLRRNSRPGPGAAAARPATPSGSA